MGPTASGKSDLALALAQHGNGEIISVDSALVYRGMDIGTAKPSVEERARVAHKLIDIRDPAESYSAAEFAADARREIDDMHARGKQPILVGGTMLYFKALFEGLSPLPVADPDIRAQIEERARRHGWPSIHDELREVDPEAAAIIHPNHSQRLSRALEVYLVSGTPMSQLQKEPGHALLDHCPCVQFALAPRDRKVLHARISERFSRMLERGFIDEVKQLHARGDLDINMPSIRAVGYRQVWEYLDGKVDFSTMKEKGIAATRQLAKRQFTWLRSWADLVWIDTQKENGQLATDEEILERCLFFLEKTPL